MDTPERNPDPGAGPPPPPPPERSSIAGEPQAETPPFTASAKADVGKRIVAAIIDGVAGAVLSLVPWIGWLIAAAYWLLRDGLEIEFMNKRSLGKALMKLRPVRIDGLSMDLETSVKRNWMLALGYLTGIPIFGWLLAIPIGLIAFVIVVVEFVLVMSDVSGRRWGDKMAGTQVIESAT